MKRSNISRIIIVAVILFYLISLSVTATDRGELALGAPQQMGLSDANISDTWTIILNAPGRLNISVTTTMDITVTLTDSNGTRIDGSLVRNDMPLNRHMPSEVLEAGTYYLEIARAMDGETGVYNLWVDFAELSSGEEHTEETGAYEGEDIGEYAEETEVFGEEIAAIEETQAEEPLPEEIVAAPQSEDLPSLPQTGVENIIPVLAIIGIAGGFLIIISKEVVLLFVKRAKRRFMFATYTGVLIILSSVTVYGLDFYNDYMIYINNLQTTEIFFSQIENIAEKTEEYEEEPDYYEQDYIDPGLIEIDGEFYLGILSIPALNLELPVNNEWSYEILDASPCRFSGSFAGSLVICAHNYRFHFANISNLSPGDEIIITDAAGNAHIYIVKLTEIIAGTDIDGMIDTPFDLTLFTCTADGRSRVTVRCVRK
jgi:sortase A